MIETRVFELGPEFPPFGFEEIYVATSVRSRLVRVDVVGAVVVERISLCSDLAAVRLPWTVYPGQYVKATVKHQAVGRKRVSFVFEPQ